jgi:hypothetical protein
MADAIIFDDGGSTRIKQLKRKLDDLLDNAKDFANGPFSKLTISCIGPDGSAGPPIGAGTFPIALVKNDTVKVFSGNHRLEGRIVDRSSGAGTATDCQITVSGINGTEPIIEARHNNGQRRYIVSNAPTISKIEVNAQGPVQTFDIPVGTIYTVVIVD